MDCQCLPVVVNEDWGRKGAPLVSVGHTSSNLRRGIKHCIIMNGKEADYSQSASLGIDLIVSVSSMWYCQEKNFQF